MKNSSRLFLISLIFFNSSSFATSNNCTPVVENNQVKVEVFNADGKVVHSRMHDISPIVYWNDYVWTSNDILKKLRQSNSANKVIFGKEKKVKKLFRTVGKARKASLANGSPIVSIGGCTHKSVKLATFRDKYPEKPFVSKNFIPLSAKNTKVTSTKSTAVNKATNIRQEQESKSSIKQRSRKTSIPRQLITSNIKNDSIMEVLGISLGEKYNDKFISKIHKVEDRPGEKTIIFEPKVKIPEFETYQLETFKVKIRKSEHNSRVSQLNDRITQITLLSDKKFCERRSNDECQKKVSNLIKDFTSILGEPDKSLKAPDDKNPYIVAKYNIGKGKEKNTKGKYYPHFNIAVVGTFEKGKQPSVYISLSDSELKLEINEIQNQRWEVLQEAENNRIEEEIKNRQREMNQQAKDKRIKAAQNKKDITKTSDSKGSRITPFGIPLGKQFSRNQYRSVIKNIKTIRDNKYQDIYGVNPKEKNAYFSGHAVYVGNLIDNKIFKIEAREGMRCMPDCREVQKRLGDALIEKYGKPINGSKNFDLRRNVDFELAFYTDGSRTRIDFKTNGKHGYNIVYTDEALQKLFTTRWKERSLREKEEARKKLLEEKPYAKGL